jgi:hypothetical protein
MEEERKIDEIEVAKRLSRKYPAPAWSFLTRVRRGTGFSTVIRTADAIAMSLFPSRGFEIQGFEIKVSKNDLKKELSQPEKAEEIQQFCHRWWIVVPDKDIITLSEIPKNWGVIIAQKNGNKVLKDAPLLNPKMIDYPFLAAIFRNQNENYVHKDDFWDKVKEEKVKWEEHGNYELKEMRERIKRLDEFEEISGFNIRSWGDEHKDIAKVVRLVLDMKGDIGWKFNDLHRYASNIVEALKGIEREVKVISKDL